MDSNKKFKIPQPVFWLLGFVAVLAAIAFGAVYGFAVLLGVFAAAGLIATYWSQMLIGLLAAGALGALVARRTAGGAGKGFLAGIYYGGIVLVVGVVVCVLVALANFHG